MNLAARLYPLLRQQTRAPVSRGALGDAAVVAKKKKHVIAGRTFFFVDDFAGFIAVQKSRLATEGQKSTGNVGVKQRTIKIDFSPRAKSRVTVLSDDPRNAPRQSAQLHLAQAVVEHAAG